MPLFFGLLVIINAVFLAWQFFEKQNAGQGVVISQQVPGERLLLLSERAIPAGSEAASESEEDQKRSSVAVVAGGVVCFRIGPILDSVLLERMRGALVDSGFEVKTETLSQDKPTYLVYIPPVGGRDKAEALANELYGKGFDASVINDPQFANAVALGAFSTKEQAESLRARVSAMGQQSEIRQTTNVRREQWLKVESAASTAKSQIDRLISGTPQLRREPASCEI